MSNVTSPVMLDSTGQAMNAALIGIMNKLPNPVRPAITDYEQIRTIIRTGLASTYFTVGDQIAFNRGGSATATVSGGGITAATVDLVGFVTGMDICPAGIYNFVYQAAGYWAFNGVAVSLANYGITVTGTPVTGSTVTVTVTRTRTLMDIAAFDYDTPATQGLTHSMSLIAHEIQTHGTLPFNPKQAFYANTAAVLPAGTYHMTIVDQPFYGGDIGKTVQFTLPSDLPAGGQLVMGQSHNATIINSSIKAYASPAATTESFTCVVSEGSDGTNLGNMTNAGDTANNLNSIQRALLGSNNWVASTARQWIKSTAASGWWSKQTKFDRPISTPTAGWLYAADPAFLRVISPCKKRTALNAVTDGGGHVDTTESVFLPSMTEINFGANNSVYETSFGTNNTVITTPYPLYVGATDADRIKYQGSTTRLWWLRGAHPSYASGVRYVLTGGSLSFNFAYNSYGLVPGLIIA